MKFALVIIATESSKRMIREDRGSIASESGHTRGKIILTVGT